MRRAAKVDANHKDIVDGLRERGVTVISLAALGKGVPDILCGVSGVNVLLELKDGSKPPSDRKLTKDQVKFFDTWKGQKAKVESLEEALKILGL